MKLTCIHILQAVPGVPKIKDGTNPATWMLDISTPAVEAQLGVDFAEIYANSELYKYVKTKLLHKFSSCALIKYVEIITWVYDCFPGKIVILSKC